MRRFFYVTVVLIILVLPLCSCVQKTRENTLPLNAETKIFTGIGKEFFVVVRQTGEGQVNIDNCIHRYNYLGYSVQLIPLNINVEKGCIKASYQGNDYEFSSGNFSKFSQGVAASDEITVVYGDDCEEIYLEEQEIDVDSLVSTFFRRVERNADGDTNESRLEIKFVLDYRGTFVFCVYSENGRFVGAALFDECGEFITDIGATDFLPTDSR